MTSRINSQVVAIDRMIVPIGTGVATNSSPSIPALAGSIAYDQTTPGILYTGDGTLWKSPVVTSMTPTFTSVTLATTGGTPFPLNYYEEGSLTVSWTGASITTGIVKFLRIGSFVSLQFGSVNAGSAATSVFTGTAQIPTRLSPTSSVGATVLISVFSNGAFLAPPGICRLTSSGNLTINSDTNAGTFSGPGNVGYGIFNLSFNKVS